MRQSLPALGNKNVNLAIVILFDTAMVILAAYYWDRLIAEDEAYGRRWFIEWIIKGIFLPAVVWILLNIGHRPVMPALVPMLPPANPGWFGQICFALAYLVAQTVPALYAIGSFWAPLTLVWIVIAVCCREGVSTHFKNGCYVWGGLFIVFLVLLGFARCLPAAGFCALAWIVPVAHYLQLAKPIVPVPMYASAIAKIKFGKYREAERAIISELEKCETDFDGWLMLAALYARQFHDLPEAERTINDLCKDPAATPSQVTIALNLLADWRLQLAGDPAAARRALDGIIARLPGTHMAHMAGLRKAQLPADAAELKARQQPKTIQLRHVDNELGQVPSSEHIDRAAALALVSECTEKLKRDPNDVEVREQLARTLADQLGELDLAMEQLNSMIEMPEQSRLKIAEWLALMASWEMDRRGNPAAARDLLLRIVKEFADTPQAFSAQRRLSLLEAEQRIARIQAPVARTSDTKTA